MMSFGLFCIALYTSGIMAQEQCLFGASDCKYACNCLQGVQCDRLMGCLGRCARGFDGPKCQRQNVALDMRTEQQPGTLGGYESRYAVDGILDMIVNPNQNQFCTHTTADSMDKSWTVYLNKIHPIYRFVIYNRAENLGYRLRLFQLQVGDNGGNFKECYTDTTTGGTPGGVIRKNCRNNQPLRGNKVRIIKPGPDALTLCEVILYVCTDGWYREECDRECQSTDRCSSCDNNNLTCTTCVTGRWGEDCDSTCFCENGVSCNKISGRCPNRCAAGYTGQACNLACAIGQYGINCGMRCGNCYINGCNRFNGNCTASAPLCLAGYEGPRCDQVCVGYYGPDCKSKCGSCSNSVQCGLVSGECPQNIPRCSSGWNGTKCLTKCLDGWYGPDCKNSCGNCKNGSSACNFMEGTCPGGCASGWRGDVCKQECTKGTWGENCSSKCSTFCKGGNTACDIFNGTCEMGCRPGGIGEFCTPGCEKGKWGVNCTSKCSDLCKGGNTACNIINGTCEMGCLPGGFGETCVAEKSTGDPDSAPVPAIAGGVVGCIVAVVVAVAVVLFLRRRKKNVDDKDQRKEMSSKTALYANVSEVNLSETETVTNHASSKADPIVASGVHSDGTKSDQAPRKLPKGNANPRFEIKGEDNSTYYNVVNFLKDGNNGIDVDDLAGHIAQMKTNKAFLAEYEALSTGQSNCKMANKKENRTKNRYRGILAYDHSRVVLKTLPEDPHSDYINASFLHGYKEPNKYIASQGPTPVMINDFVRMTWEQDVGKIIMLTNLTENTKVKSLPYWPDQVLNRVSFGKISVTLLSEEISADYVIRSLDFEHADEPSVVKNIKQFHFTSWPDHGVPSGATGLLMFRDKINATETEATGPLLVHCSAGVGRTGTYIGLDYLVKQANDEHQVDVVFCVNLMRSQRPKMIQTVEQYQFLYESVLEAIKGYEPSIPSEEFETAYRKMCERDSQSGKTKLEEIFQSLTKQAPQFSKEDYSAALHADNKNKNRNLKLLAADQSRVYLSTPVKERNNYINAVFIPGYKAKKAFIITQTPLPDTVVDFWRLLNDQLITTVITLDPPEAFASKQVGVYWSEVEDRLGPFVIKTSEVVEGKNFDVRTLQMYRGNEVNNVNKIRQYHCKFWPGNSSSIVYTGLFELIQDVLSWNQQSTRQSPILVHCLDGVSKSGMFCAIWSIMEKLRVEQQVNIIHHVKEIQTCKPEAVSNFEDFQMLHEVVIEYLKSFRIYSNFS